MKIFWDFYSFFPLSFLYIIYWKYIRIFVSILEIVKIYEFIIIHIIYEENLEKRNINVIKVFIKIKYFLNL